ncbi:MAG: RNA-binding protein [Patescibacteria group bacterium]|nr:MAG: RNA-binding protein [Patescibacteria group bacterium]
MAKRIYVGNLPYSATDDSLKDFFGSAGTVSSANVIVDKFSGRSKGFGFVEMSSDEEADKAIDDLNGKELDGRALVVNEARPMRERSDF